jgi:hypothetical protein
MTFSNWLTTRRTLLLATGVGSLLMGFAMTPLVASAEPQAQSPDQPSPTTTDSITIPSTGATIQLSQIRVATTPPAPQNPCPGAFYETPYSQYVVVPQGCRPNLITQQLEQMGMLESIRARGSATSSGASGETTPPSPAPR